MAGSARRRPGESRGRRHERRWRARCCRGRGVDGTGVVPNGAGEVQFSLAVVQVPCEGQTPMLTGAFVLRDSNAPDDATLIQSTELTEFAAYSTERPPARRIIG